MTRADVRELVVGAVLLIVAVLTCLYGPAFVWLVMQ